MLSFPRSCSYLQQVEDRDATLPFMRKKRENEATRRSERKRSLLEEISTLKEKKRRLETDFRALKHSADKAESTGQLTSIVKSDGMRRTVREKQQQIMSLEDEIENKLQQLKGSL